MKFESKYNVNDYIGKQFYHLTVIGESTYLSHDSSKQWEFCCVCGAKLVAPPYRVISGHIKSCGCMRYKNIKHKKHKNDNLQRVDPDWFIGKKNNCLTVVGIAGKNGSGRILLDCICDCGNHKSVLPYQFLNGAVKSCGCIMGKKKKTHGYSKHPLYGEWAQMIRRCYNPTAHNYERYGGRGITVCDEWRESPAKFIEWAESMGGRPNGMTLDRINNDKGYSPENCRWATVKQQQQNQRSNLIIDICGEKKALAEWCRIYEIAPQTVQGRISRGWDSVKAVTTPINKKYSHHRKLST